jgi:Zn-dependent protease/CBS domain-containing protein
MASGVSIGKLFGIDVELDWTFIILLLIVLFFGYFTIVVILFIMVLLHELGHSLTSRHYNVKVKKIVLFPLGGASIIDLDGVDPDTSFKIALAGPMASTALAAVFGLLYLYVPSGFIGSSLEILFLLNGLLAVSNFVPAFPLDGGRILKSYLEKRYDQLAATRKTVKVSKVILAIYIVVSTVYALYYVTDPGTFLLFMLWNVIIAVFIYGGAQAELESAYISKYTEKLHVYNLLSTDFVEVKPNTTIKRLYSMLLKRGVRTVLFREGGSVKMVSRITVKALGDKNVPAAKVSKFSDEIPTITYNTTLSKAISKMRYEESGIVAVMKGRKIAGILLADRIEALVALHVHNTRPRN